MESWAVVVSVEGTGIGFASAERFAADGDQVILLGRREEVLAQAAEKIPGATYCAGDLGGPRGPQRAADFIIDEYGTVDVVCTAPAETASSSRRLSTPSRCRQSLTTGA